MSVPLLSPRFEQALSHAFRLHATQVRKGTSVPYVAHLLAVTSLVLEDGGGEDEAIAALLHDAVEDQGGIATLNEIRKHYGEEVAAIVAGCTDTFTAPKPPWRARKEEYLEHLKDASLAVRRVSLADKLHNVCSILLDLRSSGDHIWERFKGGKDGTLWYYRTLVAVFNELALAEGRASPMLAELERVVAEMDSLSSA